MRKRMAIVATVAMVALAGCSSGAETTTPTTTAPPTSLPASPAATASSEPGPTPTVQDVMALESFVPLDRGTYFIDPDADPSTPLRVLYEVPVDGWQQWFGATKYAGDEHVMVSIATVTNLVRHGCRDHSRADPPVGPTVDDLATALADLAPFRVTSPPTDVTIYGYRGKHLELTVPKIDFAECVGGNLQSWIAPLNGGAYYGYTGPGYSEEFWILDVEGSRLVISTQRTPNMPAQVIAESRAILDSIRIEP